MWLCNVVLGAKGRRGRSDSGEELAGEGRGRRGAGQGDHTRPTCGSSWGSGRHRQGGTAAWRFSGRCGWVCRRGGGLGEQCVAQEVALNRRTEAGLGVRYGGARGGLRGARVATPCASARALALGAPAQFHLGLFNCKYLQICEQ
jgi:hypothetical protein